MQVNAEIIAGIISCLLTIMVLSYLVGDNPFFRIAIYIFVGVSAGYVAAVACRQLILTFTPPIQKGDYLAIIVPLLLGVSLLAKGLPKISNLGSPAMAFMVGVGAAVAIAGALLGTLVPQFMAAIQPFDLQRGNAMESIAEGSIMVVGTMATLAYFHFGVKSAGQGDPGKRNPVVSFFALIGQGFIAITFGVLFAGAYAASVTALIERLYFTWHFVLSFIK
jgi:hypothetical protein